MTIAVITRVPESWPTLVLVPVFALGEIIVLDDSGREIGGLGRRPAGWDVDVEHFDDVNAAIKRSREVTGAGH